MKPVGILRDLGERGLIQRLLPRLPGRPDLIVPAGDDCAVVRLQARWDGVLKSDSVVEGVHFLPDAPPARIGHKALARVLSDFAAMGAEPQHMLVNLVAAPDTPVRRIEQVYAGLTRLARRWGVSVAGGETVAGSALELHVFGAGRVPRGRAVLRSGAHVGDLLYVTGALGGSLLGRHLTFVPRLREGQWLRARGWATAMLDVSDGLATDLRHLLDASGVGADVQRDAVPITAAARRMADGKSALDHAWQDGEDFELLFTVPARRQVAFERAWHRAWPLRLTRLGVLTDRRNVSGLPPDAGYEHFR
jgi:thiamine-monophosphate kinase